MLIGPMLDLPTHSRQFADKRDKVGMDGVPYQTGESCLIQHKKSFKTFLTFSS